MHFGFDFRYKFEAAHRFTKSCFDSCATPHGHTWYATLKVSADRNDQFKKTEMVAEFATMKRQWRKLIDDTFDHSFMVNAEDPLIKPLVEILPGARLIEFPGDPTTELIAMLLLHKMKVILAEAARTAPELDGLRIDAVVVEETPTNTVTCRSSQCIPSSGEYRGFVGWWCLPDVTLRSCTKGIA